MNLETMSKDSLYLRVSSIVPSLEGTYSSFLKSIKDHELLNDKYSLIKRSSLSFKEKQKLSSIRQSLLKKNKNYIQEIDRTLDSFKQQINESNKLNNYKSILSNSYTLEQIYSRIKVPSYVLKKNESIAKHCQHKIDTHITKSENFFKQTKNYLKNINLTKVYKFVAVVAGVYIMSTVVPKLISAVPTANREITTTNYTSLKLNDSIGLYSQEIKQPFATIKKEETKPLVSLISSSFASNKPLSYYQQKPVISALKEPPKLFKKVIPLSKKEIKELNNSIKELEKKKKRIAKRNARKY